MGKLYDMKKQPLSAPWELPVGGSCHCKLAQAHLRYTAY